MIGLLNEGPEDDAELQSGPVGWGWRRVDEKKWPKNGEVWMDGC